MAKLLNLCILSILVYNLILDRQLDTCIFIVYIMLFENPCQ